MWGPGEQSRQEGDRKSPPSQSSPQWRREVAGSEERAGNALRPAEPAPGTGSCSLAGGTPVQTPDALSPSAVRRSRPPAPPSPPQVRQFPVWSYREREDAGGNRRKVGEVE